MPERVKIVGKRTAPRPTAGEHDVLLKTIEVIRGYKGICQTGVFRFKSYDSAQSWMIQNLIEASAANPQ